MIGVILKNARIKKGLSQKELGDLLNLADTTISSYERENSQPDFETIVKILRLCDLDLKIVDKNTNELIEIEKLSREI